MLHGHRKFFLYRTIDTVTGFQKTKLFLHRSGIAQKFFSLRGNNNAPIGTHENGNAQAFFQFLHRRRKGGLRNEKPLGCLVHGTAVRNGNNLSQLLQRGVNVPSCILRFIFFLLFSQFPCAGQKGRHHGAITCGIHQKLVNLQTVFLILFFIKNMFVEVIIIRKNISFHLDGIGQTEPLTYQRAFPFHIVIQRVMDGADMLRIAQILQIKHEVLTPADGIIHSQIVLLYNLVTIKFIPQNSIIKISRVLHHISGKFFHGQQPLCLNVALVGHPRAYHPVKITDDHITLGTLRGFHKKPGGIGCNPVITVHKLYILSLGTIQSQISCVRHSTIFLMDDTDSLICLCVSVADFSGAVRASIIQQKQFKIGVLLLQNTVHTPLHKILRIIDRNNNTYHRFHMISHFLTSSLLFFLFST